MNCVACKNYHKIWECPTFKDHDIVQHWEIAKKQRICYRCLNLNHSSKEYENSKICGTDDCTITHNHFLHKRHENKTSMNSQEPKTKY